MQPTRRPACPRFLYLPTNAICCIAITLFLCREIKGKWNPLPAHVGIPRWCYCARLQRHVGEESKINGCPIVGWRKVEGKGFFGSRKGKSKRVVSRLESDYLDLSASENRCMHVYYFIRKRALSPNQKCVHFLTVLRMYDANICIYLDRSLHSCISVATRSIDHAFSNTRTVAARRSIVQVPLHFLLYHAFTKQILRNLI